MVRVVLQARQTVYPGRESKEIGKRMNRYSVVLYCTL